MIRRFFIFFISAYFACHCVVAKDLWLENISVDKLDSLYQQIGYTGITDKNWLMIPSKRYPSVFLKHFPYDFNKLTDQEQRNALFIKILAPLALKLNQELLVERKNISDIKKIFNDTKKLNSSQLQLLENKAEKYDVFTRLKNSERTEFLISELLNRIDIIPPSIMITLAAIETDFGSSRIVKEGNSLYKLLQWHTDEGLKPIGETEDNSYRIKTYTNIYLSMKDFALRINSHPNFEFIRVARADTRKSTKSNNLLGAPLIAFSFSNSELKNYAGIIEYILSYYELSIIDQSELDTTSIKSKIINQYSK